MEPKANAGKKGGKAGLVVLMILLLVSLAGNGVLGKLYWDVKNDPQLAAQTELNKLVAEVGALISLPEGEDPTIATVTDPEKLKDQAFFAQAKAGDKVLLYTNAKKAILYSPTDHKIIEVAPISLGQEGGTTTTPPATTPPATTPPADQNPTTTPTQP